MDTQEGTNEREERGRGRIGSRAFAYIDFTSRDEWRGGEHNKVRDEER